MQRANEQLFLVILILVTLPEELFGGFCLTCQIQSTSSHKLLSSRECNADADGYCGRNSVAFLHQYFTLYVRMVQVQVHGTGPYCKQYYIK